jgi:hypothetical protein
VSLRQGDQIGRIFDSWAIVFFGQFFLNIKVDKSFGLLFSTVNGKLFILTKNVLGHNLGDFLTNSSSPTDYKQFIKLAQVTETFLLPVSQKQLYECIVILTNYGWARYIFFHKIIWSPNR